MPRAQLTSAEEDLMRRRLADAALEIYRAEGLEALTFRRLADAMGLSHTLPYRYFAHKEALLVAMRVDCTVRFERFVREQEEVDAPLLQRIRSIAAAYVEFARRRTATRSCWPLGAACSTMRWKSSPCACRPGSCMASRARSPTSSGLPCTA